MPLPRSPAAPPCTARIGFPAARLWTDVRSRHPPACRLVYRTCRDTGCRRTVVTHRITGRGSVDWLGQVHDEALGSAHRRHAPDALVLTDAADQVVAVRGEPAEDRLKIVHLERHVAQPQFVVHGAGRTRFVIRADEARQFQPGSPAGRPQHDDLGTGVRYANNGVQELALQNRPALTLEASPTKKAVTVSRSLTVMPT